MFKYIMLNDFYTHWKYIVGFFFYSILLVLPIYLNINKLASSITGTTNQVLHMAYFYYVINALWNGFFLYNSVSIIFLIIYILLIIVFGVINPYQLLTRFTPMYYIFFIIIPLMILLKFFRVESLTTLFIFVLTILSQMALYSFSEQPTYWLLGVIGLYLIGYKLYFMNTTVNVAPAVPNNTVTVITRIRTFIQFMYNLNSIEKSGIFLLFSGIMLYLYIRTVAKSYYGGQLLVNEPISLEQNTTFTISPSYHSSLSCWIYLTPSTKTEYNTLLLYGEKLLVSYDPVINSLRVRLKDDISYIETKVLLQKWNHFAFVYENGKIIIFMNGQVIHSSEWSPSSFTNELLLGKVQGKICNVRFYNEALNVRFIESLYEDFKQKNPPCV